MISLSFLIIYRPSFFHFRDCLAQMITHSTEAEVRCPYTDGSYLCGEYLQDREVKEVRILLL